LIVSLRPAVTVDSGLIWQWRNDPTTRAMSETMDAISAADHAAWFAAVVDDQQRHLLVAEVAGTPIGVVRLDAKSSTWAYVVSVNLAPDVRGRGYAVPALAAARDWLKVHDPDARRLIAHIRPDNERSVRTFESAGYVRTADAGELLVYERSVGDEP
jgi:RimJ/RimL family protein N-acetyltransferase